ncbi:MAG: hypothetical protein ACE5J2_06000 [Nitrososphaerales archaeon]
MPCDIILRRILGLPEKEDVPTPSELQDMVGAKDHEEFHKIIQEMDSREIDELLKKIGRWRKKKSVHTDYLELTSVR